MNPRKYRKGKHTYTDWGGGVKEVKKVSQKEPEKKKLQVKIDEETAMGRFANLGFISHSPEEFVIDFMFRPPGADQAKVISRILTSPGHAKRLHMALGENIEKYEKRHGKIKPSGVPSKPIGF